MTVQTTPITLDDLTTATVEGSGVFDVLMRANKAHLEQEFKLNRIKGTDYANVYLGSLQAVLNAAMQFTLSREKQNLDSLLQVKQIELAQLNQVKLQAEIDQTYAQTNLVEQQQINMEDELQTADLQRGKLSKDIEATEAQISQIITQSQLTAQQKINMMDELVTAAVQRDKLAKDIEATAAQIIQTTAQTLLVEQQVINAADELLTSGKQREKIAQDILAVQDSLLTTAVQRTQITKEIDNVVAQKAQIEAQTNLVGQQKTNLTAEALNIPKQGALLDAQKGVQTQQVSNLVAEFARTNKQALQIDAQTANIIEEGLNIPKMGTKIDADAALTTQQKINLISEELGIDARTALTTQQKDNAATEKTVLVAQECKLRAEYDSILANNLRVASEKALLDQKKITEQAQTAAGFVDVDSVLGKQKALYEAQATGYKRDAEQKAAEIMFKSWATRKTTDDATQVNDTNKLSDPFIGTAISKLLAGIS